MANRTLITVLGWEERSVEGFIEDFRKYEQGLIGGLGIEWHRLSGELRYEICNGMSEYSNLKSITKTLNFLLTFRLN